LRFAAAGSYDQQRLSRNDKSLKLTQDWSGFDDFVETDANPMPTAKTSASSSPMYSRTDPYTEDEQRAIDQ